MTDVRTSNIKAWPFDLRLDDFIVNVDVNLCGGQSALIVIPEQGPVAPPKKNPAEDRVADAPILRTLQGDCMSYDETLNRIKGARGRAIVLPGTLLGTFMLLFLSGLDAQDVTSPPRTGAAISRRMLVDPSSTTVALGKISLIVGPLTPKGNIYVGDYQIKVVPYFYKSETGTLELNAPDGTARKLAEGTKVTFTGKATNTKSKKTKLITGTATPSDKDKGGVTFYVETDNGRMTFKTSYRFAK